MQAKDLNPRESDALIRLAWHDRTRFDQIREHTGLSESKVIRQMRRRLKPASFRLWRQSVTGRVTKRRKLFKRRHVGGDE